MKLTDSEVLRDIRNIISRNPQQFAKFESPELKAKIANLYDRISTQAQLRNIYQDRDGQEAIISDIMIGYGYGESDATIYRRWSENKHESFFQNFMYQGAFEDIVSVLNNLGYTDSALRGLRYNQDNVIYSDDGNIKVEINWSTDKNSSPYIEDFLISYMGRVIYDLKDHKGFGDAIDWREPEPLPIEDIVEEVSRGDYSHVWARPTKKGEINSFSVGDSIVTSDAFIEKRITRNGHKYLYDTVNHKILGGWKV